MKMLEAIIGSDTMDKYGNSVRSERVKVFRY